MYDAPDTKAPTANEQMFQEFLAAWHADIDPHATVQGCAERLFLCIPLKLSAMGEFEAPFEPIADINHFPGLKWSRTGAEVSPSYLDFVGLLLHPDEGAVTLLGIITIPGHRSANYCKRRLEGVEMLLAALEVELRHACATHHFLFGDRACAAISKCMPTPADVLQRLEQEVCKHESAAALSAARPEAGQ